METLECPETSRETNRRFRLFLAGGITGCPDWQAEILARLQAETDQSCDLTVFNPRRKTFVDGTDQANEQIQWEFNRLAESNIILFWFPAESICPIALYELGRWNALCTTDRALIIGTHKDYSRRMDVLIQTRLSSNVPVYDNLDFTVDRVLAVINGS